MLVPAPHDRVLDRTSLEAKWQVTGPGSQFPDRPLCIKTTEATATFTEVNSAKACDAVTDKPRGY